MLFYEEQTRLKNVTLQNKSPPLPLMIRDEVVAFQTCGENKTVDGYFKRFETERGKFSDSGGTLCSLV